MIRAPEASALTPCLNTFEAPGDVCHWRVHVDDGVRPLRSYCSRRPCVHPRREPGAGSSALEMVPVPPEARGQVAAIMALHGTTPAQVVEGLAYLRDPAAE